MIHQLQCLDLPSRLNQKPTNPQMGTQYVVLLTLLTTIPTTTPKRIIADCEGG